MSTLNLGILAHVDAGKTSLTERLLFDTGAIRKIGSVNEGNTQTDSLDQERRRGITIKSAVASFVAEGVIVNVLDTPGHPDFVAEVERVLDVLDGAILVVSAVEGIQAQTRVLSRILQRLQIPTIIFVNKVDRRGAQSDALLEAIREKLKRSIVPMGSLRNLGTSEAEFRAFGFGDPEFRNGLIENLAERSDAILADYIEHGEKIGYQSLWREFAAQTSAAAISPVYFGSATRGIGIEALVKGLTELLPITPMSDADRPVSATIFKIERGANRDKVAYARMFSGTIHARDRLMVSGRQQRITAISVFEASGATPRQKIVAGQIGKFWGLNDSRIGDSIGEPRAQRERRHFPPPTLETVVSPRNPSEKRALYAALNELAEQDPLINLRQDDIQQEISVSLYGEVQKEVIQETLLTQFNLPVEFRETTTVCIERPTGIGTALEEAPNPFIATIGLRIEPGEIGSGLTFRLEVEFGSLPASFFKAVEGAVRETLHQGLYGWEVTDCVVTMTDAIRYRDWATSTAADHRKLAPLVTMEALRMAGTSVYEPIYRFQIVLPEDCLGQLLPMLAELRAIPFAPQVAGSSCTLDGEISAAGVQDLLRRLPGLTRGEGVMESEFDHYEPVSGALRSRPRSDNNPLNRKEYLRRTAAKQ